LRGRGHGRYYSTNVLIWERQIQRGRAVHPSAIGNWLGISGNSSRRVRSYFKLKRTAPNY
jgi:hypothetical protein